MNRQDKDSSAVSRRRFLQGGLGAAATGLLWGQSGIAGPADSAAPRMAGGPPAVGGPNFLVFLVDQMRAPVSYESSELTAWRDANLSTLKYMRDTGISLGRHYCASAACVPSRASLFTGHYPSFHGVACTNGAAKSTSDPRMFWLDPNTVPTMGNWFRAGGYRTYYKGKWHVTEADITEPGTREGMTAYNSDGTRNLEKEALYIRAGKLEAYGFSGWVGREPHGYAPLDSGSSAVNAEGRDQAIADQSVEMLQALDASPDNTPWLSVVSFLNPHDIWLWSVAARIGEQAEQMYDFSIGSDVPQTLFTDAYDESAREDLSSKPSAQAAYRDIQIDAFRGTADNEYRRLYYQLHKNVDTQMGRVYEALARTRFFQNTVVVFAADHGELLGAHGGMQQKWYNAYEESTHVPAIFCHPSVRGWEVDHPTSHVDILPTLLGLSGIDKAAAAEALRQTHTHVQDFVGSDLTPILVGSSSASTLSGRSVYFMTDDDIQQGADETDTLGVAFTQIAQPNHVESVIAEVGGETWKLTRYFDNPQYWSKPGTAGAPGVGDSQLFETGAPATEVGSHSVEAIKAIKLTPVADEYEMYNVSLDPTEQNNLYGQAAYLSMQETLLTRLDQERTAKRLTPDSVE